jgi:phage terminase small subunit
MALQDKQRAFITEYIKDQNATRAAQRAGYSDPNYGRQLLTNPNVQAELQKIRADARTNAVMTLSELQEWWSNFIRKYNPGDDTKDSLKASELLAKSLGGFTERHEHTGAITIQFIDEPTN